MYLKSTIPLRQDIELIMKHICSSSSFLSRVVNMFKKSINISTVFYSPNIQYTTYKSSGLKNHKDVRDNLTAIVEISCLKLGCQLSVTKHEQFRIFKKKEE